MPFTETWDTAALSAWGILEIEFLEDRGLTRRRADPPPVSRNGRGQFRRPARSAKSSRAASTCGARHARLRDLSVNSTTIPASVNGSM